MIVSIIIVNYNGKSYLENCLKSLSTINYKNYEIIVVDNNSEDDSVKFIKSNFPSIKVIKLDKNFGYAEPNNIGARQAIGDFLLFLNNDTIVTSNFINELLFHMNQDPNIVIGQSLLLKMDGNVDSSGDFIDTLGRAYSSRKIPSEVKPILSARGASMMMRKDIFWDIGGFEHNYFVSFEDVDLGWRAWIFGYKVIVVPTSIVYHLSKQTIKKLESVIQFHGVKNTLLLRLTNFEADFAIKSILLLFLVSLTRKIFRINLVEDPEESPSLPSARIICRGIWWVIKNYKLINLKRKQINSHRVRSTDDLIKMGLITKYSFSLRSLGK